MKILVVGGGGREHALVWKLAGERLVSEIVCAPGNAGIARLARSVTIDAGNPEALLDLAERENIDLTIVGPELPLSRGIADLFDRHERLLFGPSRKAAELESSKVFAKEFMSRHRVPTARYLVAGSPAEAFGILAGGELGYPVVLKADGLAGGKGVVVAPDRRVADDTVRATMVDRRFGDAGSQLVIEERLEGREASFFIITDGKRAVPLGSAEDHKRVFDHDEGPNTGGMGAFAPSPAFSQALQERVMTEIVTPVIEGMRAEGREFRGFLYVGLMLTAGGPKVIEFNARFGDPEAQVVLPRLDEDLLPLLAAAATGSLRQTSCRFVDEPHVGVVLASSGYPDTYQTGRPIAGIEEAEQIPDVIVFHAGTKINEGRLVTSGGRVLTVVARGGGYPEAIRRAYDAAARISFEGMHFRRDIGARASGVRHSADCQP